MPCILGAGQTGGASLAQPFISVVSSSARGRGSAEHLASPKPGTNKK